MLPCIRWRGFPSAFLLRIFAALVVFTGFLTIASPTPAQLSSSPSNAILGPGATLTFTITVPAGLSIESLSVLTMGAPNLDFTAVPAGTSCPNVTAGTCTVEIQFQPTQAGRRQGAVLVVDSGGNVLSVSLDGAGEGAVAGFGPPTISTFAGRGTGGDGAPAASAQLIGPTGFAVDGFGNYYIADQKANKVRKVTPDGIISTFAGTGSPGYSGDGGPATNAQLNGPVDVVVDGAGFVYISDTNNNVVRMVDMNGTITTYAGQYYAPGTTPPAVCAAATNSVGDGCPGNQMTLNTPMGLVFCHAQNLHIADKLDNRVRTVNRVGYNTYTQVGDGVQGYNGDGELNTSAELNGPTALDFDAANYIYVADAGNHIIRKTLLTGTTPNPIATVAGMPSAAGYSGDGGPAIDAELNTPMGVRVDPAGNIYISDPTSQVIRKVNISNGLISTIAGTSSAGFSGDGGIATNAQLNTPMNMFVDEKANLYIADSQNGAIRELQLGAAPSLIFAPTAVGAASPAQDVDVLSLGNSPLNISNIITAMNYSLGGTDTTCNASGQTLSAGASCVLGIEFSPTTAGSISGSVTLSDNAPSGSQAILLNGTASTNTSYTLTAMTSSVSMNAGGKSTATLSLNSSSYAGTVSFATSISSTDGTAANITAAASSVTLGPGGTGTSTLTITADAEAANHNPAAPWNSSGAALFCAALIGMPLVFWRRQSMPLVLLTFAISLGALLTACSGNAGSAKTATTASNETSRTYIVTVSPTASPIASRAAVINPAPVRLTVTVQSN